MRRVALVVLLFVSLADTMSAQSGVGINTNSPQTELDVNGSLQVRNALVLKPMSISAGASIVITAPASLVTITDDGAATANVLTYQPIPMEGHALTVINQDAQAIVFGSFTINEFSTRQFYFSDGIWQPIATGGADDLGNHTTSQNLKLTDNWISSDGDDEGIRVDSTGKVGIGTAPTTKARFHVKYNDEDSVVIHKSITEFTDAFSYSFIQGDLVYVPIIQISDNSIEMISSSDTICHTNDLNQIKYQSVLRASFNWSIPKPGILNYTLEFSGVDVDPIIAGVTINGGTSVVLTADNTSTVLDCATLTDYSYSQNFSIPVVPSLVSIELESLLGSIFNKSAYLSIKNIVFNYDSTTYSPLALFDGFGGVGIGVSEPEATLHVKGRTMTESIRITEGAATGRFLMSNAEGYGIWTVIPGIGPPQTLSISGQALSISGGNTVTLPPSPPQMLSYSAPNLSISDGNTVMIPPQTISISGSDLSISGGNTITLPGSVVDNLGDHIARDNIELRGYWLSNDGDAEGLKVDDAGRVGIGVAAPLSALHLSGVGGIRVRTTNDGITPTDWIALNAGGATGNRVVMGSIDGVATVGGHDQALAAWTNLNLAPFGNVGIGTATPTEKLHVVGNARITDLGGSGVQMVTVDNNGVLSKTMMPLFTGDNLGNHTATTTVQLNDNWLSNDGSPSGLRIDDAGRIGINVAVPTFRLDVSGAGGICSRTTNDGIAPVDWIALNAGGATGNRVVMGSIFGRPTLGGHNQDLNGWTDFTIAPEGNIGIGQLAPVSKLHVFAPNVSATADFGQVMVSPNTNANKRLLMGYDNTIDVGYIGAVHAGNTWNTLALNPADGGVAIGKTTVTPNYRLDVNGNVRCNNLTGVKNFVLNNQREGIVRCHLNSSTQTLTVTVIDENSVIMGSYSVPHVNVAEVTVSIMKNNILASTNQHLYGATGAMIPNVNHDISTDLGGPGAATINLEMSVVFK